MTKENYMKLPKERLAELLEEKDNVSKFIPFTVPSTYQPPCFSGGICTNPFHDCTNCPRIGVTGTTTDSNLNKL